jgi:hypothetical protein
MSDGNELLERLPGFQPSDPPGQPSEARGTSGQPAGDPPAAEETAVTRGPQFPDMFERAMAGTHPIGMVSVNTPDGSRRLEEVPQTVRPKVKATAAAATNTRSAEIGPFTGASAKRRRRRGR